MTDDRAEYTTQPGAEDERPIHQERRRRSWPVIAVIVLLILLVVLMWRGCGSLRSAISRRSQTNQIMPVNGRRPLDGKVSVWLKPGATIESVISKSGVRALETVDMNGGRYVIGVRTGTEVDATRDIRGTGDVYDAGRVYEGEAPGSD